MKVLVTGDRGYIGSVLVPKLLEKGFQVVGIDSGFFENNLISKTREPNYKKITKDIREVKISDLSGIDAIIHLSALSNDPMGQINPKLTEEINYKSSVRLAKLAKQANVKKFIFSSSCSIYGIAALGVVDEESRVNPLTAYAKSKIKTEDALKKLASDNFRVYLLRNSTVYGFSPMFRNDLVVNNLVTTALAFGQIRILSDGTPWRPLIDVRDLSDIFIEFLKTEDKSLNGNVINIGFNENNFQVKDLVDIIREYLPSCKVVYTGEHVSDPRSYRVRFDLFKKHFPQAYPKWPLSRSVKDIIENLQKSKFKRKDFERGVYTRLAVLRKLMSEGKIDQNLFWK
ncbi:MAG: SDR family oxidoreductase [Candidatus Levybacteria bacterium]|nr:SDR family oxidoreductase [Candidatus Levybacteria bacterium]